MSSSTMGPKYPNIRVKDFGVDGNAFALIGQVVSALRRANVSPAEVDAFKDDAMSGDYDHVVQTCMRWVECF
jgi:hypothetical protein